MLDPGKSSSIASVRKYLEEFQDRVCEAVESADGSARFRREEIDRDPSYVWDVLREGNRRARERASETMEMVRAAMKMDYPELG